jgi:hypothetical protein
MEARISAPVRSRISSTIVARRHGGARSIVLPSTVISVRPIAALAAPATSSSVRVIMSR